jgi:endonuclease V-like protein UPF0215 family
MGIDDAPFEKGQADGVPVVAVMMEGADLVESVAIASFPVDGEDATAFLAEWIGGLRASPTLQAVVLGGITIAGLGLVDIRALASRLGVPVLVATRRDPSGSQLIDALGAAGLADRVPIVERSPRALRLDEGFFLACAGAEPAAAVRLVRATLRKARLPEPLRIAHLVARALVTGESRGRV